MLIVALTGSIGTGKSTAAAHLKRRGIPVFDADAAVHRLYAGPLVPAIEAAFPGTTRDDQVDRSALAKVLLANPNRFSELEAIVHPAVRAAERAFLLAEADKGTAIAVLEIPLLFETGADKLVDATIVVTTSRVEQRRRVLLREGMTAAKLEALLKRQTGDDEKRRRADFVVDTSGSIETSTEMIDSILAKLALREGHAFSRHWRDADTLN